MDNPFIYLKFDTKVELFLSNLAQLIEANSDFYSQHNVKSGIKYYRPFHIKLLSNIKVENSKQLLDKLQNFGSIFYSVEGQILPFCNISTSGLVSLKISCTDCILIRKHLSNLNNDMSFHEDDVEVSIGVYRGPHITAFQNWLNNEFASSSAIFPIFKSDTIELTEEFNILNIPYFPIKLIGNTHYKSIISLVEFDSSNKNKSINLNNINENYLDSHIFSSLNAETTCSNNNIKDSIINDDNNKSVNSSSNSQINMNPNSNQIKKQQFNDNKNNKKNIRSSNWNCPNCNFEVFAKRKSCFKCNTIKPTNSSETSKIIPKRPLVTSTKPLDDVRKGDWTCNRCNCNNFSNKLACFTCHKVRPGFEEGFPDVIDNNSNKEQYTFESIHMKPPIKSWPGDWQCLKCKEIVFAKRNRCYKCSSPKP